MPMLVLERGEQPHFQCSCDRCGHLSEVAPSAEEASESFHAQDQAGSFLCDVCEHLQLEDPGFEIRVTSALGLIRQIDPSLDLSFGTMVRQLVETAVRALPDPTSLLHQQVSLSQLAIPLARRRNLAELARRLFPVEPMRGGALPVYDRPDVLVPLVPPGTIYAASDPEFVGRFPVRQELTVLPADESKPRPPPTPLPDWCRQGQLLQRIECGTSVRVLWVDNERIQVRIGTKATRYLARDEKFVASFRPVTPKTRWDHLLEED